MMWLYVPSTCAVDTTGSGSPLTSQQAETLARSVMWRSKYQQPRFWQTLWAKGFYPTRLSGPTCEPSTLSRGVESWISSLQGIRVNHSQSPESVVAKAIRATCGPKWFESWANASQLLVSSRTSQATLFSDLIESPKTWNDWVTALRQECLRRRKSALRTKGNGYSSWPTATVTSQAQTSDSPTPGQTGGTTLKGAARQWLTPHGFANTDASGHEAGAAGEFGKQVKDWQTPTGSMMPSRKQVSATEREALLPNQARDWATPASADSVGSHGGGQGRSLRTDIAENCSLLAQATSDGDESSNDGPTSRPQLNPRFVEWLMGVPRGWINLECSVTELSRYRALMRSALCRLCSDYGAKPDDNSPNNLVPEGKAPSSKVMR